MINDGDAIRLARWHENEAVRLRKHPNADMASTHGLAEMHGETAATLYMLLAERDAASMDADMQSREAGNMEHDARVLMDERDEAKADLELQRCCLAVARRDRDRAMAERDQERGDREEWMRQHAALDALCTRREAERDEALADWKSEMEMHRDEHRRRIQAEAERDRLQAGLLRVLQYEKKCDQTGKACDAWRGCACSLEAETWCDGGGT